MRKFVSKYSNNRICRLSLIKQFKFNYNKILIFNLNMNLLNYQILYEN